MRQGNLARHAESVWAQHADASPLSRSDYDFLLERFVDRATLHRAEALAKKWGVLPHAVMIANGWLSASDAYDLLRRAPSKPARPRVPDAELPLYTILVPLYREANMLAPLTAALARLDYPAAKLDIKLILGAVDVETIAVARSLTLPGNVEVVVVPDLHPRTKPKALNYALPLARGEYLVIYDAEDRPERDQLRKAIAAFQEGPPNLACLQAKLDLYNATENWLTRQFTIEYDALFDGLLPALDRLQLPIPLGGTSNHFRVSALKWLMAWDPFNVTEDADLGTGSARSARAGSRAICRLGSCICGSRRGCGASSGRRVSWASRT